MMAVIFEVQPAPGQQDAYLQAAAALRPLLEQVDGFFEIIRWISLAVIQQHGQLMLATWQALVGGLTEPLGGLDSILRCSSAVFVDQAHSMLRPCVTLACSPTDPLHGKGIVLLDTRQPAVIVDSAEQILTLCLASLSPLLQLG